MFMSPLPKGGKVFFCIRACKDAWDFVDDMRFGFRNFIDECMDRDAYRILKRIR